MSILVARDFYTSLYFDGVDDRAFMSSDGPVFTSFTYACWVKKTRFAGASQAFISDHVGSNVPMLQQAADGSLQLYDLKYVATMAGTGSTFLMKAVGGPWVHVAATYDAQQGVVCLYANGRMIYTVPYASPGSWGPTRFSVGGDAGGRFMQGFIDEPVAYARALSAQEIERMYLLGEYPNDAFMFYRFDEGTSTVPPQPGFPGLPAGAVSSQPLYSRDVPMTPPLSGWDYSAIWVPDSVNDSVHLAAASLLPYLSGQSAIVLSSVFRTRSDPSVSVGQLYIPNGTGATGLSIGINQNQTVAGTIRSRDGGVATGPSASSSVISTQRPQSWQHVVSAFQLDVPQHTLFINGVRVGGSTGAADDPTYTCGATGVMQMPTAGAAACGLEVARAGVYIGRVTMDEVRQWYLTQQAPASLRAALDWRIDRWNGSVVPDLSGNGLNGLVVGAPAVPFGIRPLVW